MKRYNAESMLSESFDEEEHLQSSDHTSNCSLARGERNSMYSSVCSGTLNENLLEVPEAESHCSESSYETVSASECSSEVEEASLSSSESEISSAEMNDTIDVPEDRTSSNYPTISCPSQHTTVSDLTDADFFASISNASHLQREIKYLKSMVSEERQSVLNKDLYKCLERMERVASSMRREEEEAEITKQWQQANARLRTPQTISPKARSRPPSGSRWTRKEARPMHLSLDREEDGGAMLPPSTPFRPRLRDESGRDRKRQQSNRNKEKHPNTNRLRSRRGRPTSVSSNAAGQITENYQFEICRIGPDASRSRNINTATHPANDRSGSGRGARTAGTKPRKNEGQRRSLWATMVNRYTVSSEKPRKWKSTVNGQPTSSEKPQKWKSI